MTARLSLFTWMLLICSAHPAAGQANFEDGFEDGDFTRAPEWTGSGQRFAVDTFAYGYLLRLDSPDTDPAWLSTPSTAIAGEWEFYIEMEGFTPSGSNRADIFLMSDRPDLWGDVNGYAVRMGETGDDFFKIVRYDDGAEAAVVLEDTLAVGSSGGGYRVRVTRSAGGEWKIETAEGYLGEPVSAGGSAIDAVHAAATHFGIRVQYTSTRSDRFLFDFRIDRPPFRVNGISAGAGYLELSFNREIDPGSVDAGDLVLFPDPGTTPVLTFPAADRLRAEFPDSLDSGDYLLDPGEISDADGQLLEDDSPLRFTVFGRPGPGDLQINEFAWDPPEGAPEFVELVNRSGKIFNLSGWNLGDDSQLAPLSADTLRIDPGRFLVFTADTVMLRSAYPGSGPLHRLGGMPFLNNSGDVVRLVDPEGVAVDSLRYDPSWGGRDGTLERLSPDLPATLPENWAEAAGEPPGSPGLPNRALPDSLSPAAPGDLFITEFMYDPPDGWTEFVELYNVSDKPVDLSLLELNDSSGSPAALSTVPAILPPGGHLVLAPDETLRDSFPDIDLVPLAGRFSILNNGGDRIILYGDGGEVLDSLEYTAEWGGDGKSLQRRSLSVSAIHPGNWMESAVATGTPGTANDVPADETPPRLEDVQIVSREQIRLHFSERLGGADITDPSRYRISPQRDIRLIAVRHDRVELYLGSPLQSGTTYAVSVRRLADLFGNRMAEESRSVRYLSFGSAGPRDIVINEILFLEDDRTPEFLELYNAGGKNIDLTGWSVSDATGSATLPPGTVMEAQSYLVLTSGGAFASAGPRRVHLQDLPVWNNGTDQIALKNGSGKRIDSLRYERKWAEIGPGISLERIDPERVTGDPSNWGAGSGITPGSVNSIYQPDRTPPQVLFARIRSLQLVELEMDEYVELTPEVSFHAGGRPLQVERFDAAAGNRLLLRSPISLSHTTDSHPPRMRIRNLSDPRGNTAGEQLLPLVFPPEKGDLAVNEILFAPIRDSGDHLPDQSEYVELVNRRARAISLEGLFLHDAPDEEGQVRRLYPVSDRQRWIPAGGFALLHADTTAAFRESDTYRYFEPDTIRPRALLRFDRTTLGLSSQADAVYLADSSGAVIDSVHYRGDWHHPHLPDPRGIALERIDPDGPAMSRLNWSSSTADAGGTPLAENSIRRREKDAALKQGITLSPTPFSPDSDGFGDHLAISWRLDGPDYLLRVRIHDRYGRRVRTLADGIPAGTEGVLLWDGLRDDRRRNRIGIYIVLFEAYNPATGEKRTWKKTAVLARRLR